MRAANSDVTVLTLGGEVSAVWREDGAGPWEFPLGVEMLARACLRHDPPQPAELELAIELTEDQVMPLAPQWAGRPRLQVQGLGAALLADGLRAAGLAQTRFTLAEVEAIFNRLVALSQGRPASQDQLPSDARFVAAVVIVREFAHHLRFLHVTLDPMPQ